MTGIEVSPHRLVGVEASVVFARLPITLETIPEVSMGVKRALGAGAAHKVKCVAGAQVFEDVAEAA